LRLGLRHPRQYSHTVQRIIFEYTLGRILTKYTMGRINQGMRELARDPKQIGNLIRGERKRKAMSQKELASRAGLRQASVSAIENGSPTTKLQTLLAVLSTLGLEFQISSRSTSDWNIGG
jgi:HTH-type transcriptional regulator/antitoxin HipB